MKVICINAAKYTHLNPTTLIEGKIYEANPTRSHCGKPAYEIPEQSAKAITQCECGFLHNAAIYRAVRFVPLSDIDETEIAEQRYADAGSDTTMMTKDKMLVTKQ